MGMPVLHVILLFIVNLDHAIVCVCYNVSESSEKGFKDKENLKG